MEEKILQLTLTPDLSDAPAMEVKSDTELTPQEDNRPEAGPDLSQLTEAERTVVLEFAEKIDICDSNLVMQYGAAAQKNIADFSGTALGNVRTKDMGQIGEMISDLVVELKGFDAEEERKGIRGLFKKATRGAELMKARYDQAEAMDLLGIDRADIFGVSMIMQI